MIDKIFKLKWYYMYLIVSVILSIFIFLMWEGLTFIFNDNERLNIYTIMKISITCGLLFGIFISFIMVDLDKSDLFWKKYDIIEKQVEECESLIELKKLYYGDFQELKKLSLGGIHNTKLSLLLTIMNTKIKYLK